ncbi:hypothetical protein GQR58_022564 [Nymphon striatum]|nr:hypothetical protein GQR58_022564 [Nymphon striatum]
MCSLWRFQGAISGIITTTIIQSRSARPKLTEFVARTKHLLPCMIYDQLIKTQRKRDICCLCFKLQFPSPISLKNLKLIAWGHIMPSPECYHVSGCSFTSVSARLNLPTTSLFPLSVYVTSEPNLIFILTDMSRKRFLMFTQSLISSVQVLFCLPQDLVPGINPSIYVTCHSKMSRKSHSDVLRYSRLMQRKLKTFDFSIFTYLYKIKADI